MKQFDIFKEDSLNFVEAGFIAINQADEDSAGKLFEAAHLLDPNNVLIDIGRGYLAMHKLEHEKAAKWFLKVLEKDPDNLMAKTFLGMTYLFIPTKITQGEKLCLEAVRGSTDTGVKEFAQGALQFSETFLKNGEGKKESPFTISKKTSKKKPSAKK